MNTIEQRMPQRWGLTRAPQPGPVGHVCVQSVVQDGEVAVRLCIVVPPASRKRARHFGRSELAPRAASDFVNNQTGPHHGPSRPLTNDESAVSISGHLAKISPGEIMATHDPNGSSLTVSI